VKAYWWRGKPNFGDAMTPLILGKLGVDAEWASVWESEFVACGSVLTHLPPYWAGAIWGTGKARKTDKIGLPKATVLALRGKLSAATIPGSYALGDPGLFANLVTEPSEEFELGIVPHWEDKQLHKAWKGHVIDVTQEPEAVIRAIARCKRIVSSSLHGIITADALGLERRWALFPKVQGQGFKFRDHATVVGAFEPNVWSRADARRVASARTALAGALERYRQPLVRAPRAHRRTDSVGSVGA